MLADAVAFAAEAHRYQLDKRGEAYILHPLRIVLALKAAQYPEVYQVVAVLHDVVEDTEVILEEVRKSFGDVVEEAVDALTRRGHWKPRPEQDEAEWIWEETYKEYIQRCCQNLIARTVKRFDVYDNFDPRRHTPEVPVGRYVWTLEYLQKLDEEDLGRAKCGVYS